MELRWNGNWEQKIEALGKTPVSLPTAAVQIEHSLPRIKTGTHLCGTGQEPTTFISQIIYFLNTFTTVVPLNFYFVLR